MKLSDIILKEELNVSRNKLNQLALNIGFEEFAKTILMLKDENILDDIVDAMNFSKDDKTSYYNPDVLREENRYNEDGYDEGDLPDPPVFGTNWIRLLFDRSEWDTAFGENFTTDMQSNSFCGPKQWRLVVESNAQGPLELEFIFNNNVALDVFENLVIEIFDEDQSNIISNGTILEYDLEEYSPKEFLIEVEVN